MIVQENQFYRITYEAFSKFSNSLTRCRTFEEITGCLKTNLKYLFNFHAFRTSYSWGKYFIHITVTAEGATMEVREEDHYLEHERILLEKEIPMYWADTHSMHLPSYLRLPDEEQAELWGWLFKSEGRRIMASVLSGKTKQFTKRDITFVKLVADNLESKLLELCLFQELDEKNTLISSINLHQQEVIHQRTQEIATKNEKLMEISILNAHQVREPLSRILGLISLVDYCKSTEELKTGILPRLKKSSSDLDSALQTVITKATEDLIELKA